ncbi:MAG: AbrB/MazE/SpoVT family DNA-binding domain-containing protein [Nitrososphaeraceae archaeon]|nr:AbrB/MazE/SpoVT family DNA-binding domain-containing protein [Nitrososphaeraceae archaeon]
MQKVEFQYRKIHVLGSGQSAGVCIPKQYLKNLSLISGDVVKMRQEDDRIIIQKIE